MSEKPVTVLIADDEVASAFLLAAQLNEFPGVQVLGTVGNGNEALVQVEQLRPDVLVLDLSMPEVTGFGVLLELRGMEPERRPRAIVMSKWGDPDTVTRVYNLGAEFFFQKPFRVQELVQLLWSPKRPTAETLLERMLGEGEYSPAFFWAADAMKALARDPRLLLKEAYDPAMTAEGQSYANVEKGIRKLIERAEKRHSFTYRSYFHTRPSNGVFLHRLAQEIAE